MAKSGRSITLYILVGFCLIIALAQLVGGNGGSAIGFGLAAVVLLVINSFLGGVKVRK
jgi:hypothetical protein